MRLVDSHGHLNADRFDGDVELEVRPGVQSGDVLTIKGRGITPLRGGTRGDLRVAVQVVTPTRLDAKERALIEDFAKKTKAPEPRIHSRSEVCCAVLCVV